MQKIKPSKWYYAIPIFMMAVGCLFLGADALPIPSKLYLRVVVPGKKEVTLPKAGKYVIFSEYISDVNDKVLDTPKNIPGLQCELRSIATGEQINLTQIEEKKDMSICITHREKEYKEVSIFNFDVKQPGVYTFSCQYEGGGGQGDILTIRNYLDGLKKTVKAFILLMVLGIGTLTIAVIATKRAKSKKQIGTAA